MSLFSRKSSTATEAPREKTRSEICAELAELKVWAESERLRLKGEAERLQAAYEVAKAAHDEALRACRIVQGELKGIGSRLDGHGGVLTRKLRDTMPSVLANALTDLREARHVLHSQGDRFMKSYGDYTAEQVIQLRESYQKAERRLEELIVLDLPEAEIEARIAAIATEARLAMAQS